MAKYGVFIRFDVDAETEYEAQEKVFDTLIGIDWELYQVEEV